MFAYRKFIPFVIMQIKPSVDMSDEIPDLWSSLESEVVKFNYDIFLAASSNANRYGSLQAKIRDLVAALMVYDTAKSDEHIIIKKDTEYGGSWRTRGGVGAFMMLARKWDRIKEQTKGSSISERFHADQRDDGIRDDLNDLRRYLIIVLAYWMAERNTVFRILFTSPFVSSYQHSVNMVLPYSTKELQNVYWFDSKLTPVRDSLNTVIKNPEDRNHYEPWISDQGTMRKLIMGSFGQGQPMSLDNQTVIEFRLNPLTYLVHENSFSSGELVVDLGPEPEPGSYRKYIPTYFFRPDEEVHKLRDDQQVLKVQADPNPGTGWMSFVDPGFWMSVTIIGSEIVLTTYLTLESMVLGTYGTPFATIRREGETAGIYMMWMAIMVPPPPPKEVIEDAQDSATATDSSGTDFPF